MSLQATAQVPVAPSIPVCMADAPHCEAIIIMMRTTVNLPDDIYEVARSLAVTKHTSLGEALAELARRGLNAASRLEIAGAFPRFAIREDAGPITLERTQAAEDEA